MQHRPFEIPQFKRQINQQTTPLNSARLLRLLLRTASVEG